jgi:hypothetical protein
MMVARWIRLGLLIGLGVSSGVAACGSDDGAKKARGPGFNDAGAESGDGGTVGEGEGGVSGMVGEGEGGEPGTSGTPGTSGGGSGGMPAEAGAPALGEGGGAAGVPAIGGAGGTPDPGPRECPSGTADCDDNPEDCETDTAGDAQNCGRCGRECGATAACSSGLCDATVILNPSGSSNFCDGVFSPTTAYMVTCWGGFTEVRSTPVEPGATVLGTQIQTHSVPVVAARGILIDGNDVLYGLQGNPSYLYKFPLDANGPEDITVGYTFEDGTRFDGIKLIGDTFYWSHNTHAAAGQILPGFIKKRTKAATSSTTLVTGLGLNYDLQVFATNMVWLERRTTSDVLTVYRAPIAGAAVADVEVVAVSANGGYMVRHGDYAYWTDKAAAPNGKIRRLRVDDDEADPEDVATNLNLPEGIITDDAYAYFKQLDALYRVPLGGGLPEQLSPAVAANDAQATRVFYVDDSYVYFAAGPTGGASTLVRVAK